MADSARLGSLTAAARSLWGKSDYGEGECWLPLYVHMADAAGVAGRLWDRWLPKATRGIVARAVGGADDGDDALARTLLVFLAGVHDVGKATPVFQAKGVPFGMGDARGIAWKPERAGFVLNRDLVGKREPTHPIAGELILERYFGRYAAPGCGASARRSLPSIVGAHHGNFPTRSRLHDGGLDLRALGWGGEGHDAWESAQDELVGYAARLAGIDDELLGTLARLPLDVAVESLLTGMVIVSDWLASDCDLFPLLDLYGADGDMGAAALRSRLDRAWSKAHIPAPWSEPRPCVEPFGEFFSHRFGLPGGAEPRPIQRAAEQVAWDAKDPGLMVIEAPMGEGKTEAALAAAELLAYRRGLGGVCVALPTMATTDAMFARVRDWLDRLPRDGDVEEKDIYLAHGKAGLNEEFQGLVRESRRHRSLVGNGREGDAGEFASESATVSAWMYGRKKGMLSNFVVCTVDQVLMGALHMRHLSLRQLALANKVVVIDECHAYDLYMRQYLDVLLQWLGYWRVPTILLSATLPDGQRASMAESYLSGRRLSEGTSAPVAERRHRAKKLPAYLRKKQQEDAPADAAMPTGATAPEKAGVPYVGYPQITYTDGTSVLCEGAEASGRSVSTSLRLIEDSVDVLVELLKERLRDGGCAGVICDTVGRAQEVERALAEAFGEDVVMLDHSRFIDLDRMSTEEVLRDELGPAATVGNGKRPRLRIVVGTQVLEQSLDIDFDLLVTDVAPVDLLLQRLGRTHRHKRGEGECERPAPLRESRCYIRGVKAFEGGRPTFAKGVTNVYDVATLVESLSVLGMTADRSGADIMLPRDIPQLVRDAYSGRVEELVPDRWKGAYEKAKAAREYRNETKIQRAHKCLLQELSYAKKNDWTLVNLADKNSVKEDARDSDRGNRAVRDTQETIEVLLARKLQDGEVALLPWIGDEAVVAGSVLPTDWEPSREESMLLAECAVRLPLSICPADKLDDCIEELERGCVNYVRCWQESPWLAGRLLLPMEETEPGVFECELLGKRLRYTRRGGLATVQILNPSH